MRSIRFLSRLVFSLLVIAPLSVMAADAVPPSPIVKTELIVDAGDIGSSNSGRVGVRFTMPKGWDIYWQNPGDSGMPTRLSWTLPEGITAGGIQWPTPERIEVGGLVNYGYHGEVILSESLTANRTGISGPISVKANWLVCKDICIPESATLTGTLPSTTPADAKAQLVASDARLPQPLNDTHAAEYRVSDGEVFLNLLADTSSSDFGEKSKVEWFPIEDGVIANSSKTKLSCNKSPSEPANCDLVFARGTGDLVAEWHGVLSVKNPGDTTAKNIAITAKNTTAASPTASVAASSANTTPQSTAAAPSSILTLLLFAFIGGLILNIMPCVLPILALKALALSKKAQASRRAALMQGVSYTAGVVLSFLVIAGIMLALKATGAAIGWGFQLQNPYFVGFLALVMVAVGANLLGLFELPVLFGEKATAVDDTKLRGSFFTGVLAVLVATPCTAPFMATAIGATLALPAAQSLSVFAALGFGLAAPFLLISIWPAARRLLPKPGAWMHRFKQLLAIPMLATAAWLIFVLAQLVSPSHISDMPGREPYSPARLEQLRAEKKPVLVDATADWCITCKVNERVALNPPAMQAFFKEKNVTILVADWTANDPVITQYLASFGRNGVPLVVYYPPGDEPLVLPQILTPGTVREAINGNGEPN